MATIYLLNGPNLNALGMREPELYGNCSLKQLETTLQAQAASFSHRLICKQSNHEGELVDLIQQAKPLAVDVIIINPGAYAHTSIAIRDALLAVALPFIEVHISNIYRREAFRHHSFLSDIATGIICGLGVAGYELALQAAHNIVNNQSATKSEVTDDGH